MSYYFNLFVLCIYIGMILNCNEIDIKHVSPRFIILVINEVFIKF